MERSKITPEMLDIVLDERSDERNPAGGKEFSTTEKEAVFAMEKSKLARSFFKQGIEHAIRTQNRGGDAIGDMWGIFKAGVLLGASLHEHAVEAYQLEAMMNGQPPSGSTEPCLKSQQQQAQRRSTWQKLSAMGKRLFCRRG